jgi:UDP-GlcNAc:undecaprenyl-phosphate GlcNAc-1-phosphate transferase
VVDGQTSLAVWCFAMIAAILPYILLNLGVLGRRYKVFMGDAGSTLIGFTVIWILLETTQGKRILLARSPHCGLSPFR